MCRDRPLESVGTFETTRSVWAPRRPDLPIGTETVNHGFFRDRSGNLTFPIDFPGPLGPTGTVLRGVNDRGWIVGTYYGLNSKERGFFFRKANGFFAFDYPGALATSLSGISNTGLICGSYIDSLLLSRRGFIGRLR